MLESGFYTYKSTSSTSEAEIVRHARISTEATGTFTITTGCPRQVGDGWRRDIAIRIVALLALSEDRGSKVSKQKRDEITITIHSQKGEHTKKRESIFCGEHPQEQCTQAVDICWCDWSGQARKDSLWQTTGGIIMPGTKAGEGMRALNRACGFHCIKTF